MFISIQLSLVFWASLPLPDPYRGSWPWAMFDRRGRYEKRLHADGILPNFDHQRIPLEELFQYSRGFTDLRAYDQIAGLDDARQKDVRIHFAHYLAQRMAERGVRFTEIELYWMRQNLDTGVIDKRPIGTYSVGTPP